MEIKKANIGSFCKKYLLNKYVITILIFVVVYVFVGDQSLSHRLHRSYQIRKLELQLKQYLHASEAARHELVGLQNPDSLTRYARENYYMHENAEDVYVVFEK